MGSPAKGSLQQRCLAAVLAGASTIDEVLAVVGRTIPASQAVTRARTDSRSDAARASRGKRRGKGGLKRTLTRDAAIGRRRLVANVLIRIAKEGKIARTARGVYGPPVPKLFQPGQTA